MPATTFKPAMRTSVTRLGLIFAQAIVIGTVLMTVIAECERSKRELGKPISSDHYPVLLEVGLHN
ncbi:MAG: hypothetical protein C0507_11070 [Cyanobacteria bacterium PR.3.49]|nr:hypothetical protein [Cyanobacteria bacterium PR.3.49]